MLMHVTCPTSGLWLVSIPCLYCSWHKLRMLESYVTPLLMSYVNRYIKNLKPSDLQLSLWGGDVVLSKLDLKLDVLEQVWTFLSCSSALMPDIITTCRNTDEVEALDFIRMTCKVTLSVFGCKDWWTNVIVDLQELIELEFYIINHQPLLIQGILPEHKALLH